MNSGKESRIEQGISSSKPPLLKPGQYEWWVTKIADWIQANDGQAWIIIQHGDLPVPKTILGEDKEVKDYGEAEIRIVEKNAKARQLLTNALSIEDSTRLAGFATAKERWDALKELNEGTEDLKKSRIFHLTTELNDIRMKAKETVEQFHGRYATIANQLQCLGEKIEAWKHNCWIVDPWLV